MCVDLSGSFDGIQGYFPNGNLCDAHHHGDVCVRLRVRLHVCMRGRVCVSVRANVCTRCTGIAARMQAVG